MKRIALLLGLLISVFISVQAQLSAGKTITGIVVDSSTNAPLEYVPVTLYIKGNTTPLTGTVTDEKGRFVLKGIHDAVYRIEFEFIGYKPFQINGLQPDKNKTVINLKNILLSPLHSNLQSVTVVSRARLIENKIDKMVYNAEKDLTSQTGVATDVLKKVPSVSIDVDGNVQLSGSSGVRFLINGKPSTAFGSSIADVLQSIPAAQIKSIEVITNPGAKYDAQGLGGIINIILKTSNAKGYNGSVSLTAGTRMENGSFNFNVRNNNFGINAFLSGNKRLHSKTPYTANRLTNESNISSTLYQEGSGMFERHGWQAGTGFDWTYKKKNNFSGSVSYNNFGNSSNGSANQDFQVNNPVNTLPVLSLIQANNAFDFNNTDASLNYKRTFTKEDQELELSVNSSFGNNHNTSANEQSLLPQDSLFYGTSSMNPGKIRQTEVKIDYSQPIKKDVVLGVGGKMSFYSITSNSDVLQYQPILKIYQSNPSLADDLSYKQKVYAAYSELGFPVGHLFKTKLGIRYERTEINSYYSNAQQQVKVPGYNTIVPSIFFSKKIGRNQTLKLSYSKRIERPDYGDLNPFVNTNDPKNITAGNPYLNPEIGHRSEFGYSREIGNKGSVMLSIFYRINDHDIQPYIVYYPSYKVGDSVYTNVSVTTRQNIGMEKNLGLTLFADVNITSKLYLRTNVLLFRRYTINTLDNGYNYTSINYRFNINASYQFTNTLLAEFFGNFNAARHEAQGSYPSFTTYSLAARKQFWKKKGSIAIVCNNFLNEYINQKTILTGPGFSVYNTRKIPFRSLGINFAWKFGKLEFKKSRTEADTNLNSPGE